MRTELIIYAMTGIALGILFLHKISMMRRKEAEKQVVESLRRIAESMRTGNTFEAAIKQISDEKESSAFFKKVLKESNKGKTLMQALSDTAEKSRDKNIKYIAEVLSLTISSKGNIIASLERLSDRLSEISHLQRKIDVKAASALTTLQVLGIAVLPGIFYFLAGILGDAFSEISINIPLMIYLGAVMVIFSMLDYLLFRNFKESMYVLPAGVMIFILYITELGPLLANFGGI
jgi:Flp pilus assembly protein TadB